MLSSLGYIKNLTIDRPLSKFEHTMLDDILSNPSTRGISIHADGCLFALFSYCATQNGGTIKAKTREFLTSSDRSAGVKFITPSVKIQP